MGGVTVYELDVFIEGVVPHCNISPPGRYVYPLVVAENVLMVRPVAEATVSELTVTLFLNVQLLLS